MNHFSVPEPSTPATPQAHAKERRLSWNGVGLPPGMRLTPGDLSVLDVLTRYGVASHEMIQTHVYGDVPRTTTRRLSYLQDTGLITPNREREHVHGRLYAATTRATRMVYENGWTLTHLSPYTIPTSGDLTHRLALTDVGIQYEEQGFPVVTEREIRAAERMSSLDASRELAERVGVTRPARTSPPGERPHVLAIPTPHGLHYPDMVIGAEDGGWAVEVELTAKDDSRVRQTLSAYTNAENLAGCLWLVSGKAREQLVGPRLNGQGRKVPGLLNERPGHHAKSLELTDRGVQYALDKRELGREGAHLTKTTWEMERVRWQEDARGKPAGTGFQHWYLAARRH